MTSSMRRKLMALAVASPAVLMMASGPAHAVKPGEKAPDFSLAATTAKQIQLKDFAGKSVVLFFYIAAFTNT